MVLELCSFRMKTATALCHCEGMVCLVQAVLIRIHRSCITLGQFFRPSLSPSSVFLQHLRSSRLSATRSSISYYLLPFILSPAFLLVTSPYLPLHSSYRISPIRLSLASTVPRKIFCSSILRDSSSLLHSAVSLIFSHLILLFRLDSPRLLAFSLDIVLKLIRNASWAPLGVIHIPPLLPLQRWAR